MLKGQDSTFKFITSKGIPKQEGSMPRGTDKIHNSRNRNIQHIIKDKQLNTVKLKTQRTIKQPTVQTRIHRNRTISIQPVPQGIFRIRRKKRQTKFIG